MNRKGLTFLEIIITLSIFAIIGLVIFNILKSGLNSWDFGYLDLFNFKKLQKNIPIMEEKLRSTLQINNVSLADNNNGYIQYLDADKQIVTIFLNTATNQQTFGPNSIPTSDIVICYSNQVSTSDPAILIENVTDFYIETFSENSGYVRIATKNNITSPVPYNEINAVRIKIKSITKENKIQERYTLIHLSKYPLSLSGDIEYKFDDSTGFTLQNIKFISDVLTGSNGAVISTQSYTVRIANTGQYYTSIQAAINDASSGNEIQVCGGIYTEYINLKAGVTLLGGFEPLNWTRHITNNQTILKTNVGIIDSTVIMADNSKIDGFTINGQSLTYGIKLTSSTNFKISNCNIDNCETSIYIQNSTGTIQNNNVTGDIQCIIWNNTSLSSGNGKLIRNKCYNNNIHGKPNIWLINSQNTLIEIKNNIILYGNIGIELDKTQSTIINNIIMNSDNQAIYAKSNSSFVCLNNIIANNRYDIYYTGGVSATILNNYFVSNRFRNLAIDYSSAAGNILNTNMYDWTTNTNPILDVYTFQLLDTSPAIDQGLNNTNYNDNYTANQPCKGTTRNDIGAYGGPYAGRIGQGTTTIVSATDDLQTIINTSWPGDQITLEADTYMLSSSITLRKSINITGANPDQTLLNCTDAAGLITADDCEIRNLQMNGNQSNIGIQIPSNTNVKIKDLLLKNFLKGIQVTAANANIYNLTCTANSTAIAITNSTSEAQIYNSILTNTSLSAIEIDPGASVYTYNCLFMNNATNFDGTAIESNSITGTSPLFFTPGNLYNLDPSSNAINAGTPSNIDIGCFEFYKQTGTLTFPTITTQISKQFKKITAIIEGDNGTIPNIEAKFGEVEIAYMLNNSAAVTLSPTIRVLNNTKITQTWDLGPRTIGKNFKLRAALKSYQNPRTPYLNNIVITW